MTSICMHMYVKTFFPDSSLVSVKMRHISLSVKGSITTPPRLLHNLSKIHGLIFSVTALAPFPTVHLNFSLSNN